MAWLHNDSLHADAKNSHAQRQPLDTLETQGPVDRSYFRNVVGSGNHVHALLGAEPVRALCPSP